MNKSISIGVVIALSIFLFAPPGEAFGFDIFKTIKKQPVTVCEPDEALDSLIYSYNSSDASPNVSAFLDANGYENIGIVVEKDNCKYEYTVMITDSHEVLTMAGLHDVDLKISSAYNNVFFAHKSYIGHDSFGILSSALKVKMPMKARINAIIFLRSYI